MRGVYYCTSFVCLQGGNTTALDGEPDHPWWSRPLLKLGLASAKQAANTELPIGMLEQPTQVDG
jgi:hypothetical protein